MTGEEAAATLNKSGINSLKDMMNELVNWAGYIFNITTQEAEAGGSSQNSVVRHQKGAGEGGAREMTN